MAQNKPGFPTVYQDLGTDLLLAAFERGHERVVTVLKGLTLEDLKAQPRPGKWSIFQIILHLADAEIMGAARIRQAFAEPGSTFSFYDQDIWADTFDYQNQGSEALQTALQLFENLRRTGTEIFRRAKEEDWQKAGLHPEHGNTTLRNVLELYADHSERHIAQILEIRKLLGKELDFPLLIEKRLY